MEVEWLILADAAQVVGNKLYVMGGGWDRLTVNKPFPVDQRCALALALRVDWNETNQRHNFEIEIISEDSVTEQPRSLMKAGGQFELGRPPGISPGQDQRFQVALDMALKIDSPGTKVVVARVGGQEMRRLSFNVIQGPKYPRAEKPPEQGD
ncbi:MAG: hypothetical protein JXA46_04710 [Dehalococcoidales bacterium]|nr:hypothetical protein [Dehalococcoidales bacterium]